MTTSRDFSLHKRGLDDDIAASDVTTDTIVPADASLHVRIVAKQEGIVAG